MKTEGIKDKRELDKRELFYDLVVVGGGLAGVCASLTAARKGITVALVQDRPVLGGNASSEVRVWALGATSHMGNNNRWAREGGIIDEIMVENIHKNKEGNPIIFDTILLDKILQEEYIDLYLNTAVYSVVKSDENTIQKVCAFNAQNSTVYNFYGKQFIDSSGDGIMAYQAGVPYRIGAEVSEEFSEGLAPNIQDYGELLGHTLFFYSKKLEHSVSYTAPEFALKDIDKIPRIKNIKVGEDGCKLWWFEYGGRRDTIRDTEEIKLELWKVAYGIWNHIKNSGDYEDADCYTLEWVGLIPGKRESRRFEGYHMLSQADLVEQRNHYDAISYGGWALDLHPADGVYSEKGGCTQWHTKGVYQIPFRSYIPRNINNLMLAGRIISASHVAFGSTRVMVTCAHGGQAVGMAAALCIKRGISPKTYIDENEIVELQDALISMGHYIPGFKLTSGYNLAEKAKITTSGALSLDKLPANGKWQNLNCSHGQMLPIRREVPAIKLRVKASQATVLSVELRISSKPYNHTPDIITSACTFNLKEGEQNITVYTTREIDKDCYLFVCLIKNELVSVALTDYLITGIVSVANSINPAVSNYGKQEPQKGLGVDEFEFWCPKRRPDGANIAFELSSPIELFDSNNLVNGVFRPVEKPNAWIAGLDDEESIVRVQWDDNQIINRIKLFFDPDYDHPMETVQMQHHESDMPFIVKEYELYDQNKTLIFSTTNNYQAVNEIILKEPLKTTQLELRLKRTYKHVPISMMGIVCM